MRMSRWISQRTPASPGMMRTFPLIWVRRCLLLQKNLKEVKTSSSPSTSLTLPISLLPLSRRSWQKSSAKKPNLPSIAGREENNTGDEGDFCFSADGNLTCAPGIAPAPAQLVESPLSTGKSTQYSRLVPSTVQDPTSSLGGSQFAPGPSTSALPHQIQADAGSPGDSVEKDSMDKNSDTPAPEKEMSERTLKQCRVQLPRMSCS